MLIYNSYSGSLVRVDHNDTDIVTEILSGNCIAEPKGIFSVLAIQGILVPCDIDELDRAECLHKKLSEHDTSLDLSIMPTEQCNFRCVYCYEDFSRGKMSQETIDSLIRLIQRRAASLSTLSIGWFGGEPLLAIDLIEEISNHVITICESHRIKYNSSMSTNGYLLTDHMLERCLSQQISQFQITLDGPSKTHNTLRVLAGGGDSYNTILANLRNIHEGNHEFHIRIRVNFTPSASYEIPEFLKNLGNEFGGDPRFSIYFHTIGRWGGAHDNLIETCDKNIAENYEIQFMAIALKDGFGLETLKESMQPFGSVCYAANPRSFVIGSDGTIYKCTVAFNDPRNRIGRITSEGKMDIDEQLHNLWISSGEETDKVCQICVFRPACQGNSCPLTRLDYSERRCPRVFNNLKKCLQLFCKYYYI